MKDEVPVGRLVSLRAQDIALAAALTEILFDADVDVELLPSNQIALVKRVPAPAGRARADPRHITGLVVDVETKMPLSSATVLVTGTAIGTTTSDSGTFGLSVPDNATSLTVRRLGYRQATVPVSPNQPVLTIALSRDVLHLETQVVTGVATTISSRNAANAVAVVSGDQIQDVPAPTLENALQGKIPGALIEQNNGGAPGGWATDPDPRDHVHRGVRLAAVRDRWRDREQRDDKLGVERDHPVQPWRARGKRGGGAEPLRR
jgi:hypothetical protein